MALFGLLIGKFVLYCAFFLWAPRLLKVVPVDQRRFALNWAAIRLVLGLLGIVPALLAASALGKSGVSAEAAFLVGVFSVRALIWRGSPPKSADATDLSSARLGRAGWPSVCW